jgi:hypothetical protein
MENFNDLTTHLHASTIRKLDIWMRCHPDSCHPNDKERFMDLIREANINDDLDAILNLDWYKIVNKYYPLWIEEYVDVFIRNISDLISHEVAKCYRKRSKISLK